MDANRCRRPLRHWASLVLTFLVVLWAATAGAARTGENIARNTLHLTLENAIARALTHNRSLLNADYSVKNRDLSVAAAQSAFDLKLKPLSRLGTSDDGGRLTAGIGLSKTFDVGIRASLAPEFGRVEDSFQGEMAARIEIPLFRGFGRTVTLDDVNSSRFALRSARRSYHLSSAKVVLDTVIGVYDMMRRNRLVDLFQTRITSLDHHLQDVRLRQRVGLAGRLDVYRADIQRRDAQDSLALAREARRNAGDRLKLILAISQNRPLRVSAPLDVEPVDLDLTKAVRIAARHRVEIRQAEDALGEARRQASVARENLLPGVNLVAGYVSSRSSALFGDVFRPDDARWTVSLMGSTDWARRAEKSAYQQRLNDVLAAQLNLEHSREEINREVRQQLDALRRARKRIDLQREQIRQAEGKLALAAVKFQHNMAGNFDVMDADRELQRARINLLNVRTDYIVGTYRLRRSLGTLLKQ